MRRCLKTLRLHATAVAGAALLMAAGCSQESPRAAVPGSEAERIAALEARLRELEIRTANAEQLLESSLATRVEESLKASVGKVVVGIKVVDVNYNESDLPISAGTAFAIDDGLLMTNFHVVEDYITMRDSAAELSRTISQALGQRLAINVDAVVYIEGQMRRIEPAAWNSELDYAVLRIVDDLPMPPALPIHAIDPGKETVARGIPVFAAGYPAAAEIDLSGAVVGDRIARHLSATRVSEFFRPEDFELTLTDGILSRVWETEDGLASFQHTAIITSGNSGGPLLTRDGTVVAVNTAASSEAEGYGVGIGINTILEDMNALRADRVEY